MATLNMTTYAAALKEMYPKSRIENLTFQNNPLLAMMPKDTSVGGTQWKVPVQYEDIAGQGATFATAQANKDVSRKVAFNLTAVRDYALASIDGLTWRSSLGNNKAFLAANKSELDSAFNAMKRSLGIAMYRSGNGEIGRINATVSGTTLTLVTRRDINNFARGMKIVFAATAAGALRDSGEALTVNSVNRSAGSMVVSADLSTISGITSQDFIFREGDAANNSTKLKMTGLLGWLPTTAPTSGDSHFGVDRSADSVRLAGNIINATGLTVEEAFIRAVTETAEQGGAPDHIFCPFNVWEQLGLELGSRKEYADTEVAGIHFRGMKLYSPEGEVKVYADRNCPSGNAFLLSMKTWTLYSVGECPGILDLDDVGTFLRESTSDSYELRVGAYPQMGCVAPGHNAVLTNLPT